MQDISLMRAELACGSAKSCRENPSKAGYSDECQTPAVGFDFVPICTGSYISARRFYVAAGAISAFRMIKPSLATGSNKRASFNLGDLTHWSHTGI